MFAGYAVFFFPAIAEYKIPICLFIIWSSALLNILGIVPVGKTSIFLGIVVLVPFLVLFGMQLAEHGGSFTVPAPTLRGLGFSPIAMGLYTVMWNFIGWDNATTYAGEVRRPARSYLLSISLAFAFIVLVYIVATLAVHQSGISAADLDNGKFPVLGELVGGYWLGALLSIGGMASSLGLYSAVLLSVSRIPEVMAEDNLLPSWLCSLHSRFGTPYLSIIASSVVVSVLALWTFSDLVIMDIVLYGAGMALEFVALFIMRVRQPLAHRPFRIPLNKTGLVVMILLPVGVYGVALSGALVSSGSMAAPALLSIGMLFSAELVWRLLVWRTPGLKQQT
jgi:amino acid transporter